MDNDSPATYIPGLSIADEIDERRQAEQQYELHMNPQRPDRSAKKQDFCMTCLEPVDWRMDHREWTTGVWAKFGPGTDTKHKCKLSITDEP